MFECSNTRPSTVFWPHVGIHYITLAILRVQVKNSIGEYITVPHIPEALQVNIGAVLQRWTADKYIAPVSWIWA